MLSTTELFDLIKHGAVDILEWPFAHNEILECVNSHSHIITSDQSKTKDSLKLINGITKLSKRELQILALLMQGIRNKEIAYRLDLSVRTIELHRSHINDKLKVKTLIELTSIFLSADQSCLAYFKSIINQSDLQPDIGMLQHKNKHSER